MGKNTNVLKELVTLCGEDGALANLKYFAGDGPTLSELAEFIAEAAHGLTEYGEILTQKDIDDVHDMAARVVQRMKDVLPRLEVLVCDLASATPESLSAEARRQNDTVTKER